jgi:hypothetical protein
MADNPTVQEVLNVLNEVGSWVAGKKSDLARTVEKWVNDSKAQLERLPDRNGPIPNSKYDPMKAQGPAILAADCMQKAPPDPPTSSKRSRG